MPISIHSITTPQEHLPFERAEIEESIIARWKRVVSFFPERVAISCANGDTLSYTELDRRSNALANALLAELGYKNLPILLLLDHSQTLLISILGVIKANKAYVALDPHQPVGQLRMLSGTADSPLIVTDREHLELANDIAKSRQYIWLCDSLPAFESECPAIRPSPDSIAGIFFTSGTIKRAKGVPRTHRIVTHRAWFGTNFNNISADDSISGIRQCGLGAGMVDVFNSLLNGATYAIYNLRKYGLHRFSNWLQRERITYFHPSIHLFRQWLETLSTDTFFPHMRVVAPTGRKNLADLQRLWPHVSDRCVVLTSYSATETTLITCTAIDRKASLSKGVLHVGRPIPDKQVSIVGDDGKHVAMGDVGEIHVRSRFVSSCYWRQPELSSKQFSPPDDEGEVVYRTGDWGRLLKDGSLELLGRQDSQVKINGYRVLLDDIEDALRELPAIVDAVVFADQDRGTLDAYAQAVDDPPMPSGDVRAKLAEHLPSYALPSRINYLSEFPLLGNGKINRRALSAYEPTQVSGLASKSPRNHIEQQLVGIWADLLELQKQEIGIRDNFFELGGHSLLAMRLMLEVESSFDTTLDLDSFIADPTVSRLAKSLNHFQGKRVPGPNKELLAVESSSSEHPKANSLDFAFNILDMPPEERHQFKPSAWSRWETGRRLTYLGVHCFPTSFSRSVLSLLTSSAERQSRFFDYWRPRILEFLESVDCRIDIDSALASSLYFGMINRYRVGVPKRNRFAVWRRNDQIHVDDLDKLTRAKEQGRGVVLVRSHDQAGPWLASLKLADYRVGSVGYLVKQLPSGSAADENALFAHQLRRAIEKLREGQVVEIHGDGFHGTGSGIEYRFHQRRRRFQHGFAELAVISNADVFVVDCTLQRSFKVEAKLVGPLNNGSEDQCHKKRSEMLLNQYLQVLHKRWAETPWMVTYWKMSEHLKDPVDEKRATTLEQV